MNGLDKIIEQILADSDEKAKAIIDEANNKSANIIENAKTEAGASVEELAAQGENDAQKAIIFAESSAHMEGKKLVLQTKSDIIDKIISEAHDRIINLETEDYFKVLLNMIGLFVSDEKGEILLNGRDLERIPDGFEKELAEVSENKFSLSKQPCDIDAGFILNYGGIEENCSFETIFKVKNEQIRDTISSIVF